jgi:hypothetical protein
MATRRIWKKSTLVRSRKSGKQGKYKSYRMMSAGTSNLLKLFKAPMNADGPDKILSCKICDSFDAWSHECSSVCYPKGFVGQHGTDKRHKRG